MKQYYLIRDGKTNEFDPCNNPNADINNNDSVLVYAASEADALSLAAAYDRDDLQPDNMACTVCGQTHVCIRSNLPDVGASIRLHRIASGQTQTELAETIGATQQQVSWWESGRNEPGAYAIIKIAAALGIDPGDLLK